MVTTKSSTRDLTASVRETELGRSRRVEADSEPALGFQSLTLALAPRQIALFKAIIESYDNLATLRTEDPRRHRLRIYFAAESAEEVKGLIASLGEACAFEPSGADG